MEEQSLKQKTIKGVSWSFLDSISGQGITFLVGLVLARLLTPEDYGVLGVLMVFISIFNAIVDSGFTNALIRKKDVTEKDYSTCFYTNLSISIILFLLLFITAPYISLFFNIAQLTPLLRVMGIIIIINALSLVQRAIFVKKVDFKTQTRASIVSSVSSGVVGISLALSGAGVWSLVGQQITRQFLYSIVLFYYDRWIPSLVFSKSSFINLWSFGSKLLASTILDTAWRQVYQVIIGKVYTPLSLGLYTRALQFAGLCSDNISAIIQRVTYPILSSIQDDKNRLKQGYRRIIKITMLSTFVLMIGLASTAKSFVYIMIGEQWIACVSMLQILCFSMMLYPLHSLNLNMLQVSGRSYIFLKLEILKKIVGLPALLLGIFMGIYWMLICSVITGFFCYYLNAHYSGRYVNYTFKEQVVDILPSLLISIVMGVILLSMSYLPLSPYLIFPLQIVTGAIIVIAICEWKQLPEYLEIKAIVTPIFIKFIKRRI